MDSGNGERTWHHAGVSQINPNGSYRVRIPDRLFKDTDILKLGRQINWYYETTVGVLMITNQHLERDNYEYSGESTTFKKGSDNEYKSTIPKEFFPDYIGSGSPAIKPRIAQVVNLIEDDWLHFMYHDGMAEGRVKSCYVFTSEQFDQRFSDSDRWDGELDQVPRFH